MKYISIFLIFILSSICSYGQKSKVKTIPLVQNYIDYGTFPILGDVLPQIKGNGTRNFPFILVRMLDDQEVQYYTKHRDSVVTSNINTNGNRYYVLFWGYCDDCDNNANKKPVYNLLKSTNRFMKVMEDWYPVIIANFDNDFYLKKYTSEFTSDYNGILDYDREAFVLIAIRDARDVSIINWKN